MLDIRATHYVSPISEVDFASVPLTVHLTNVADETGLITGAFRIYNDITGLLIFTSDIAPLSLPKAGSADASALTDFDPPAPLDDTYFVVFDGLATNDLVPDGIGIHLGASHFDVKPVGMGPAPAAHHATHEDGGSDPLDHGTLPGLADDDHPQYQLRSEQGAAAGYPALPDPLDSTLPLLADGTPGHPDGVWERLELLASSYHPWAAAALTGGAIGAIAGTSQHPGIRRISSAAAATSGGSILTVANALLLASHESTDFILRPQTLANTTIRVGYLDTTSSADATDGVYLEMAQVGGVDGTLVGKTANNGARSTTVTSFVLVTNTWYRLRIILNANATRVDFYLYDEAGALLWTDNLTTNIPTAAGRETGHGLLATTSGSSVLNLVDVDYIDMLIARVLTR